MIDIDNFEYYIFNPIILSGEKKINWMELWINKNDYINSYYESIKGRNAIIDDSIDYYIAMTEMAIYYLKGFDNYYDHIFVQHKLILENNFFNRFFLKDDVKERDFAEYIKFLFLKGNYNINYIYNLVKNGVEKFNYELVVARLLFPSYYFYFLEKTIVNGECFSELESLVRRADEYENYILSIVNEINKYLAKKIILPF